MLNSKTNHDKNREIPITTSGKNKKSFIILLLAAMSVINYNVMAQTLSFTYSPDTINVGDTVTFTNTSTGFDSTVRWVWNYGYFCSLPSPDSVNYPLAGCNDTVTNNILVRKYLYPTKGLYVAVLVALSHTDEILETISQFIYIRDLNFACTDAPCDHISNGDFASNVSNPCAIVSDQTSTNYIFSTYLSCWDPIGQFSNYYLPCFNNAWVPDNWQGCQWETSNSRYVGVLALWYDDVANQWKNWRSYIHQTFQSPTSSTGGNYCLSIKVSLAERSQYASNGLQVVLSFNALSPPATADGILTPPAGYYKVVDLSSAPITYYQDWLQIDINNIVLTGSVREIYIGNFRRNPGSTQNFGLQPTTKVDMTIPGCGYHAFCGDLPFSYYYLDQVKFGKCPALTVSATPNPVCLTTPPTAVICTTNCSLPVTNYQWSTGSTASSITVYPTTTTTYTVTVTTACGTVSASVMVTVVPPPIATASSNSPVCANATINLYATGGTQSWTGPNGYSSSQQNPSRTNATTNMAGIYTVTVTANGCTATATTNVVINAPTISVSASATIICEGESVQLSASGANSYSWWPLSGLSSPSVPVNTNYPDMIFNALPSTLPAGNYTYVVTGTDGNGCTGTASVTITVLSFPQPVITGLLNNCTLPATFTVQSGYGSYQWDVYDAASTLLSSTAGTNSITFTSWPVSGAMRICVTVTLSHVAPSHTCSATTCIPIYDCCLNSTCGEGGSPLSINNTTSSYILHTDPNFASCSCIYSANTIATDQGIIINGTFKIDEDITFEDCPYICLGPEARIEIQNGHKLYLLSPGSHSYTNFFNTPYTKLAASCGIMWDGIYIQDASAQLIVDQNNVQNLGTIIRDARNAVVSDNGGDFQINLAKLNQNNTDMIVNPFSNVHNGKITSSELKTLSASMLPYYTPNTLSINNPLPRTYTGIEINKVHIIHIGDDTNPAFQNVFDNMNLGINILESTVWIQNNHFKNMIAQSSPCCLPYPNVSPLDGFAIRSTGDLSSSTLPFPYLYIGYTTGGKNIFEDCTYGIYSAGSQFLEIKYNDFIDANTGIGMVSNKNANINIKENHFDNFILGISAVNNYGCWLDINTNYFNQTNTITGGTAISVKNPLYLNYFTPDIHIRNNQIQRVYSGINTMFMTGISILSNDVLFDNFLAPPSVTCFGIRDVKGKYNHIADNEISRCSTTQTLACWPQISDINKFFGVSIDNGTYNYVFDNIARQMGTGFRCFMVMSPNTFKCNNMIYSKRGFTLYNSDPGVQGSYSAPCDNFWSWVSTSGFFPSDDVWGNNTSIGSRWWVRGTTGHPYAPDPLYITPPLTPPIDLHPANTSATSNCAIVSNIVEPPTPEDEQKALAEIVVIARADTPVKIYNLNEQARYLSLRSVYTELYNDNSLLNLGTIYDEYLQSFYDSAATTNLASLTQVNFLTGEEDKENAFQINSTITPENFIEQNEKMVNEIYLSTWGRREGLEIYEFNNAQTAALTDIAMQSPLSGGPSVYTARVMLGLDINDLGPEETEGLRLETNRNTVEEHVISLYPNPANNNTMFTMELGKDEKGTLEVFDVLGNRLLNIELLEGNNETEINTASFSSGVYIFKASVNREFMGVERLMIVK